MKTTQPVLVVAAHPDDEVLGAGGTISKMARLGFTIHVVFMTDGVASRGPVSLKALRARRRRAACDCLAYLGAQPPTFLDFPDNELDSISLRTVAAAVEQHVEKIGPSAVLTHHAGDLNVDHRLVHEAVMIAGRPQPGSAISNILCFEVPSSTEWRSPRSESAFIPNVFADISDDLDRKVEALRFYMDEMRPWPHPRSLRGVEYLARWRGATVGKNACEAFSAARIQI